MGLVFLELKKRSIEREIKDNKLVRILPEYTCANPGPIGVFYRRTTQNVLKISAFLNFIKSVAADNDSFSIYFIS